MLPMAAFSKLLEKIVQRLANQAAGDGADTFQPSGTAPPLRGRGNGGLYGSR